MSSSSSERTEPKSSKSQTPFYTYLISLAIALVAAILAFSPAFRANLSKAFSKGISDAPSSVRKMATTTSTTVTNGHTNGTVPSLKVTKRPWDARGHADHGWLYTYHTFNFASYYEHGFEEYGPLRVINEDRVERGTGFGTHAHAEFLIFSYIVAGELEHKDSMGNLEYLKRGEVQFTSAGTGIRHSEYNRNKDQDVHFLQIWARPNVKGLTPHYATKKYSDEMKQDKLVRIMESTERFNGKDGESDPIALHADLSMDASILSPGKSVEHEIVQAGKRKVYLHVVMSGRTQPADGAKIKVGDTVIAEGDGAFVDGASGPGKISVENVGDKPAEFLLFDMGM